MIGIASSLFGAAFTGWDQQSQAQINMSHAEAYANMQRQDGFRDTIRNQLSCREQPEFAGDIRSFASDWEAIKDAKDAELDAWIKGLHL